MREKLWGITAVVLTFAIIAFLAYTFILPVNSSKNNGVDQDWVAKFRKPIEPNTLNDPRHRRHAYL